LKKAINTSAVLTSIDNILRTYPGERVMLPEFGSGLKALLFENMSSTITNFLSRELKETIERWENRVIVTEIRFVADPDNNSIAIGILFVIKGHSKIFEYKTSIKGEM
jgi:phage baseplate assembly protein W